MPRLTDLTQVRAILERDRPWTAYALGDLSPGFAEHCEWFASEAHDALVLLFHGFDTPILFSCGDPDRLPAVLSEIHADEVSLHLRVDAIAPLRTRYPWTELRRMWRMVLEPASFVPVDGTGVEAVTPEHIADLADLYTDGVDRGETPDFFFPSMVDQGTFRGIRESGRLVAAAGTHLFAPDLGVCAIGNVYTRQSARGRGLASRVTSAVAEAAFARGVRTIVLNVRDVNGGARRVYERLGFRTYCEFVEGSARRAAP